MNEKRILLILILIFLSVSFVLADVDTSGMTPEQRQQYNRQKLSVSEKVITTSSSYGGAWATSSSTAFAYSQGSSLSTLNWDAFQGPNQITKERFFTLAGEQAIANEYKACAERVAKKHSDGLTWTVIGGIGVGVGAIVMFAGIDGYVENKEPGLLIGAAIELLSCIPLFIGVRNLRFSEEPNISASFAFGVADVYNQKLAATITAQY